MGFSLKTTYEGSDGRSLSITSTQKKNSWESENNRLSEMQRIYHTKEFRNTSIHKLFHSLNKACKSRID